MKSGDSSIYPPPPQKKKQEILFSLWIIHIIHVTIPTTKRGITIVFNWLVGF